MRVGTNQHIQVLLAVFLLLFLSLHIVGLEPATCCSTVPLQLLFNHHHVNEVDSLHQQSGNAQTNRAVISP